MFAAVHADRAGRIVLAADYAAAADDGLRVRAVASTIPLPANTEVVPLAERVAVGMDRTGRPRPLGAGRFAVGAILPPGYVRLLLPAYGAASRTPSLAPRPYAAVAANELGELVVAAALIDAKASEFDHRGDPALRERIAGALRDRPSNALLRQLARCAREYGCRAAANAFLGRADCALPVAAPSNERPPDGVGPGATNDASPREPAAFHPTAHEVADVAAAHLAAGGVLLAFGRACEGEPLLAARLIEAAVTSLRRRTSSGVVHVETNGSLPAAIRRLIDAGVDSIALRVASARAETHDTLTGSEGFRLTDVRASLADAVDAGIAVALVALVMPGVTDRERESDALIALAGALPPSSRVVLRDLAADPDRVRALLPTTEEPHGVERMIERLRAEAPHATLSTHVRPLVRA